MFLCLFVGGGGGQQQIPQGLQGEEEETSKVKYEKRREREHGKDKNGKRKSVKDTGKDWILKKKEVSYISSHSDICEANLPTSYTENVVRRMFQEIPSSQAGNAELNFDFGVHTICSAFIGFSFRYIYYPHHIRLGTNRPRHIVIASRALLRMNSPCNAAMLILFPLLISSSTIVSKT